MTIGEKIRELREKGGLTQAELAEKTFVTQAAINKVEHNIMKPGVDLVARLSKVFNCTTDFLMFDTERDT